MKKLVYLLVISVFFGAQILAIDAGVAKISMYRMIFAITVVALGFQVYQNHPKFSLSFNIKNNQYKLVYLFWLFIAVVSIIWAEDFAGWINGVFFVSVGILSIILISYFMDTERDIRRLFLIIFVMIGFHQLIGWFEVVTNYYQWAELSSGKLAQFESNPSLRNPYSIFTNINDYSTLIYASIPVSLVVFSNTKKNWLKSLSILSVISVVLLLMRTGSRGNQLALITFIATLIIVKVVSRKVLKYSLNLFGGFIVVSIFSYFIFPGIRLTVYSMYENVLNGTGSNIYRIRMILNGFVFLFRSLGFGVGSGNVEHWMVNDPVFVVDAPNIHNWFMDILVGYGIITFTLYLVMYIYILRQLFVSYKYSHNSFIQSTSFYLFAYVVSFIFSSISSASNIFIEWQWVLWGVIIAYIQYAERKESELELHHSNSVLL